MNKERKATANKGFSLVELIIVIAIMAVLIGVLAPQYMRYVEKSRVSADTQLCDNVYQAINVAYLDPDITGKPVAPVTTTTLGASAATGDFWDEVYTTLGVADYAALKGKLKAAGASDIQYAISSDGSVTITNTNNTKTITIN